MKKKLLAAILAASFFAATVCPAAFATELAQASADETAEHQIQVGDYVALGQYNRAAILWRCVAEDENGLLMLSDKILTLKAYDAKGSHDLHYVPGAFSGVRASYGSNCWKESNLREWLNSKDATVQWSHIAPSAENVQYGYNAYDGESGFLSPENFTEDELSCMKTVTRKVYVNVGESRRGVADGGSRQYELRGTSLDLVQPGDTQNCYYQNVTDTMFVLDITQLKSVYDNFNAGEYIKAYPTEQAVATSSFQDSLLSPDLPWGYWTNHPGTSGYASYEHLDTIDMNGNIGGTGNADSAIGGSGSLSTDWSGAYLSIVGVRPGFYLADTVQWNSGEGTREIPYIVSLPHAPIGNPNGFSLEKDSWSFANQSYSFVDDLDDAKDYRIPQERLSQVYGGAYNETYARYKQSQEWGGNCAGMVTAAMLFFDGKLDWSKINDRYKENDFSTVNRFYGSVLWEASGLFDKQIFVSASPDSRVTKLIEAYQLYVNEAMRKFNEELGAQLNSSFFTESYTVPTTDESGSLIELTEQCDIRADGNYMQEMLIAFQQAYSENKPLLISLQGNGGHAVVSRTDLAPYPVLDANGEETGWWRIPIYDPNWPLINSNIVDEFVTGKSKIGQLHLVENQDTYLEINIEQNTWQYIPPAGKCCGRSIAGETQYAKMSTSVEEMNTMASEKSPYIYTVKYPEFFLIYDLSQITPQSDCWNPVLEPADWLPDDVLIIPIDNATDCIVYDSSNQVAAFAKDGGRAVVIDNGYFDPYEAAEDSTSGSGGKLVLPKDEYTIILNSGDIQFRGDGNAISIASDTVTPNLPLSLKVDISNNEVCILSETENEVAVKCTNVFSPDEFNSVATTGILEPGKVLTLGLDDNNRIIAETDGTNKFDIYSKSNANEESSYIETIPAKGNEYLISAIANSHGSITPSGNIAIPENTDQTFTIAPDDGYAIADVLVDGTSVGPADTYTFAAVAANHTIEAFFQPKKSGTTANSTSEVSPDSQNSPDVHPEIAAAIADGTWGGPKGGEPTATPMPSAGKTPVKVPVTGDVLPLVPMVCSAVLGLAALVILYVIKAKRQRE